MLTPSAHDIVRIWELGQDKPDWYQAMLILAAAFPECAHAELAEVPLGLRNHYLFALRARIIGQRLDACVNCPKCQQALEFSLNVSDLCAEPPPSLPAPATAALALTVDGIALRVRLPSSRDLEAIGRLARLDHPARDLACRCIASARFDQDLLAPDELDDEVLDAVSAHLAAHDPLAGQRLSFDCNACGHGWSSVFDIISFFWTELSGRAQRLLGEVHLIASNYGWRESDIRYLDLLA